MFLYLTRELHDHRSGRGGRTGVWPGVADGTVGCFYWARSWRWARWGWSVAKAVGIWQSLGDLQQQPHHLALGFKCAGSKSRREEFQYDFKPFFKLSNPNMTWLTLNIVLSFKVRSHVPFSTFLRLSYSLRNLCNWEFWVRSKDFHVQISHQYYTNSPPCFCLTKCAWFESDYRHYWLRTFLPMKFHKNITNVTTPLCCWITVITR